MRHVDTIIIHCADTPPDWMAGQSVQKQADEIRRWHVEDNGWTDIGYHFVIGRVGDMCEGRQLDMIGAHTVGHNEGSIGICLIGGAGSKAVDMAEQHFTDPQLDALAGLIEDLQRKFPSIHTVAGHNQYAARECPGFIVSGWLASRPKPSALARLLRSIFGG